MQKPNVLLLGASEILESALRAALKESCKLIAVDVAAGRVAEEYQRRKASAAIVVLDPTLAGTVVSISGTAHDADPFAAVGNITAEGGPVIVVSPSKDPELILRAMRAGAREFVLDTDLEDLRHAIRVRALSPHTGDTTAQSSVVTVFGAKGGVGSTTIAANLAGALQASGQRVCLVDLNLHLGDVLSFMDVPGTYSITDLCANMARLDDDLLRTSMIHHDSGVDVLAQSGKMEEAEQITAADVAALLSFLRRHYDRVVIDGVRGFDDISLAALDASQHVLMVLTQDVPAVRNGLRCLEMFKRLNYDESKVRVVLNRHQKGSRITMDVVRDTLHMPVAHTIGNDFASVIDAINRGLLLKDAAPRARLTNDIQGLLPLLAGPGEPPVRRSFFGGLFGGKKAANGAA
jgi:pilus assembly protein CpaE